MAYIKRNIEPLVHTKITDYGRKKLSETTLSQIRYFQVGDSEINYKHDLSTRDGESRGFNILRAKDNQDTIKYPIPFAECETFGVVKPTHRQYDVKEEVRIGITNESSVIYPKYPICLPKNSFVGTNQLVSETKITCDYILVYVGEFENGMLSTNGLMMWYKIIDFNGVDTYTVDRPLPDYSYIIDPNIQVYAFPYSKTENTDIWDFNIVRKSNLIGEKDSLLYNKSYGYDLSGLLTELGYVYTENENDCGDANVFNILDVDSGTVITGNTFTHTDSFDMDFEMDVRDLDMLGIIHYSKLDNYYGTGEWWDMEDDAFVINLPSVMYHNSETFDMGLKLVVDRKEYMLFNDVNTQDVYITGDKFYYLKTLNDVVVGKVFADKQLIIIEDQELLMSLSYKSNRNFTLPIHRISKRPIDITPNNITDDYALLRVNTTDEVYVTYMLYNETDKIYYYPQTYKKKLTASEDDDYDINFSIGGGLSFIDTDFEVNKVYAIVQKVTDGELKSDQWKKIDVTDKLGTFSAGDRLVEDDIINKKITVSYEDFASSPYFYIHNTLGYPFTAEEENMIFGDEFMLFGDITLVGGHTVYESNFEVKLTQGQFLKSLNPTWSEGDNLYISEIGLYDLERKLVSYSKISIPTKRDLSNNGEELVFSIKLDF